MKKIVCIALAACFLVALVSFSSSAAEVVTTELPISGIYFQYISGGTNFLRNPSHGFYIFDRDLGFSTPTPLFSQLAFYSAQTGGLYTVPEVDGRGVSLSVNLQFLLSDTGYLSITPSEDILSGAIFTDCMINVYFSDGTSVYHRPYDTYVLKDDINGEVIDPNSVEYWSSVAGSPANIDIWALFDLSDSMGKTINSIYILFPSSSTEIYYSNTDLNSYFAITDPSLTIDFLYTPFNNVVIDDLSDIKTQLGTIDQDVNRVNQSVTDLKDTIEDFQQDLTSSDSSISSDISDKQDIIDSIQDAMQNDNALLDDNLNDMITGFPGAQDPFHNAPSPDGFFAVDFIQQLWSFIKAQTIFFDFIFLGLCFCLATFILRR